MGGGGGGGGGGELCLTLSHPTSLPPSLLLNGVQGTEFTEE